MGSGRNAKGMNEDVNLVALVGESRVTTLDLPPRTQLFGERLIVFCFKKGSEQFNIIWKPAHGPLSFQIAVF